jgi:uncharacterized protein with von Willebrand factor type A (vWA) domain
MEERIIHFISALRAGGIRVSLAESADAMLAINQLGVKDRDTFRLCLRSTLVKKASDLPIFDELFPLFFDTSAVPALLNISEDLTPEEIDLITEALHQFKDQLRDMLERLLRGDQLQQSELDQLGRIIGLNQANDLRYRDWIVQRMEKALKFQEVQAAIQDLMDLLAEMGMNRERINQLSQLMQTNQLSLQEQIRRYTNSRIAENMSQSPPENGLEGLLNRPFNMLSDKELDQLQKEVKRLAAALRTRIALRQKRAKSGQLDAKATIRANLKHGSVPIEIKHKDRTLKPRLIIICDISTSMRPCSELMLSLIFAIQDQISKTHAFAFIDHLEFISPDLNGREARDAVANVLLRMPPGHYNTDFGFSLMNFTDHFMDTMNNRSTLIVVGDGRNNYNDPRLDLFSNLSHRSNRTIWLNPESPVLWGSGDSDMLKYAPHCDTVLQVSNLTELTAAVDRLLA